MSFFASHMKSSFPLSTFDRCCTVIRYSRVKRNPFQKSRVKKSLKKKFRFMDAGSEAMVANFSYTTQKSNKAFFKSAFLLAKSHIQSFPLCTKVKAQRRPQQQAASGPLREFEKSTVKRTPIMEQRRRGFH